MSPVIKSKPGGLCLVHLLIASFTSDGEKGVIGLSLDMRYLKCFDDIFSIVVAVYLRCAEYFGKVCSEGDRFFFVG